MDRGKDPVTVQPEDTLRMPAFQLDTLLGRRKGEEEPVFPLVRRVDPSASDSVIPKQPLVSRSVSIVLAVALVLGTLLLLAIR